MDSINLDPAMYESLLPWLLEGEPWVRYRTLTDLLRRKPDDSEVEAARNAVPDHQLIRPILARQKRNGWWGRKKDLHTWWPKNNTTFWLVGTLADFGLTIEDEHVSRACACIFDTQLESGGFLGYNPDQAADCHTGILTESLAKAGKIGDARLERAYRWLRSRQRLDGGWWCKDTGQPGRPREAEPSCALATMFVLGAFAHHPRLQKSDVARRGVEFMLGCWEKRGTIKYAGHDSQIGTNWGKLKYPYTDYRILKYLDVVSRFPHVRGDRRVREMAGILVSKRGPVGRYTPESIHKVWHKFDFGQKKNPSRWITALALGVVRRIL
ncbi:hypothetical protein AMJ39_03635 [candidate division TA06 bacterium DG_24]|uniref:Squalene cyclase C-terminal domain-containing protein n=3 Tax=Bacteria division TA06 TaxID=1156500 RepID=A0A0S8JL78_UNCT6|nr:MAG: hypothetical protein AMJ39_03635 [candidate division TA06 bacterium DG_24]KPK67595.1 MAG: hypothetical protein AMJ82_10330 [candidate division TA06 bacterium SM23_40]KPL10320.1 MAG: hypothetical protein AMJ71_03465 [candidate division TA06 bacterium SM1_40]